MRFLIECYSHQPPGSEIKPPEHVCYVKPKPFRNYARTDLAFKTTPQKSCKSCFLSANWAPPTTRRFEHYFFSIKRRANRIRRKNGRKGEIGFVLGMQNELNSAGCNFLWFAADPQSNRLTAVRRQCHWWLAPRHGDNPMLCGGGVCKTVLQSPAELLEFRLARSRSQFRNKAVDSDVIPPNLAYILISV